MEDSRASSVFARRLRLKLTASSRSFAMERYGSGGAFAVTCVYCSALRSEDWEPSEWAAHRAIISTADSFSISIGPLLPGGP